MRRCPQFGVLVTALLLSFVSSCIASSDDQVMDASETSHQHEKRIGSGAPYWMGEIKRQGTVAYGANSSYVIWRNVMDFGAAGDGVTDDTVAINDATLYNTRCVGTNASDLCDSSTTTPAIVYFPAGTYLISAPIVMPYYTQCIGDANNLSTILGASDFEGIALFDSDPYIPSGNGSTWYANQNNFWRHVRNFVLDMTQLGSTSGVYGVHWQVAQGTSLQNLVFNMVEGNENATQTGLFMENGSGGMIEDLIFNGGGTAWVAGNQQWTSRNITINNCVTGINQIWNWVFNYKSIYINNCQIGLDMSEGGNVLSVGSIAMLDVVMTNISKCGILTGFNNDSTPVSGGTLVLDNVDFVDTPVAIMGKENYSTILAGNQLISGFLQGRVYSAYEAAEQYGNETCYEPAASSARVQEVANAAPKPASLLDSSGIIFERGKPQYEGVSVDNFVSIKTYGCTGDGVTDETTCVQDYLNSITTDQIAFIDHGAYVISDTIQIPNTIKMVGEIWPLFMVDGSSSTFSDIDNPNPAFKVGDAGDVGAVEMQEIIFETIGPAPGAIMMEWNLGASSQGSNAMWDVHWRIGGSNGTQLQSTECLYSPGTVNTANSSCFATYLLVHITSTASVLMSNNWGWVADHELDLLDHSDISLYNGRGLLIESQGPVWIYGSSIEHSMLYNYQIANAKDIYLGHIQSETAYMQANPNALTPYTPNTAYPWSDPSFSECELSNCYKTYGLRIENATYILIYGAGHYSFFDNYDSGCLLTTNCQQNMISIEQSEGIYLYAMNTVGAYNMIEVDLVEIVPMSTNVNWFCNTVAVFEYP